MANEGKQTKTTMNLTTSMSDPSVSKKRKRMQSNSLRDPNTWRDQESPMRARTPWPMMWTSRQKILSDILFNSLLTHIFNLYHWL